MASLTDTLTGLKNKPEASGSTQQRYPVQYINYACLEASAYNFYPMSEIEDLADAIELAGGILQPLLVRRKAPGHYEIIAGHRRWTAAKHLVEQGRTQYAMLPCHVQDGNELVARINLIVTNSQREKTPYIKMQEITELEQLLQELASGSEEEKAKFTRITGVKLGAGETVTARVLRKLVAKKAGLSETNVARLKHINQNLEPALKEAMEAGKIGISVANELASMKPEEQQMVAKQINAGEKITLQPKEKNVKAKEKQDAAESRSVSESDTTQNKQSESQKNELASMKPEEQQMVAKQINAGEKITLQPKEKNVKAKEKQDAAESRSVSESDTTQNKQSESQKIVKTEQHEEEQLPGQISVDDYVSEGFELRGTNKEEIDVAVSVDDVAKKESSTTTENDLMQSLAHDYLTLYEREDGSETEWQAMHKQLADYFASLLKG